MLNKIFIFFTLFLVKIQGYNFYKKCEFKTLHINEPQIFNNMNNNDIISMSKKYGVSYEKQNILNLKKKLYEMYMKNKKIYIIDIDNTICKSKKSNYINSIPYHHIINSFNKLYEQGHQLHYWTARGSNSGKDWSDFTLRQMKIWGVKYNTLNIGKIHYNLWIDDKAIHIDDWIPNVEELNNKKYKK
tara:strand:- start:4144 stop:4704 length:561 start_codon:yes stop_codon:yes gene_type:complete